MAKGRDRLAAPFGVSVQARGPPGAQATFSVTSMLPRVALE